jgi:chaperone modulatory protein CbpM
MKSLELKSIELVCHECSIKPHDLLNLIVKEWIVPADSERHCFDEEDIARVRLISELLNELEVGENAIPIILNLLDQIHVLRKLAKK